MTTDPPETTSISAPTRWVFLDSVVIPAGLFLLAWPVYAWLNHARSADLNYFVPLADAFIHGRWGLIEAPSWLNELVPWHGLYYVVYPPMPALVVLPAVILFGPGFEQAWASILLGAANVAIMATVLSFNILGDWLRDFLDPRLKTMG